jgi:hypothetical protein
MPNFAYRPSDSTLIYINLALGVLVALSNGGALAVTLAGKAAQLEGKQFEIAMWLALGLVLVGASIVGIFQRRKKEQMLKMQALIINLLCVMLSVWGLTLVLGRHVESRTIWSLGYLTVVAVYATYLIVRAFAETRFRTLRLYALVLFLPACILVDVATYLRVEGSV